MFWFYSIFVIFFDFFINILYTIIELLRGPRTDRRGQFFRDVQILEHYREDPL